MNILDTNLPFVSTILVTRNEGNYIEKSLDSLLNQTYPKTLYEIIIVDGESTDDTIPIAKRYLSSFKSKIVEMPSVVFLENPKKILSAGWNLGIKAAKGNYVVRIDAHAEASVDFLLKSVETMNEFNATCVGGKLITVAIDEKGKIVRNILSSSFGVGNSSFRVSNTAGYADTAVYGLYKKEIFDRVGFFDEWLVRNQDIEMHTRIKKAGGNFYFNPEITCKYYSRSTFQKMLKQGFQNGKWNLITLRRNKTKLSFRHLVPLAFLLFLVLSTIGGLIAHPIWIIELGVVILYLILALIASCKKTAKISEIIKMVGLFFLLHMSYGVGSLLGIFTKIKNN